MRHPEVKGHDRGWGETAVARSCEKEHSALPGECRGIIKAATEGRGRMGREDAARSGVLILPFVGETSWGCSRLGDARGGYALARLRLSHPRARPRGARGRACRTHPESS